MKHGMAWAAGLLLAVAAQASSAFCGFYVAKADTRLFNEASKVVIMRDEQRTVLTMANDYRGDLEQFAMVVPVPVVLQRDQIHVTNHALIDHLDAYTAPRLVEYFDPDPCRPVLYEMADAAPTATLARGGDAARRKSLGVTVEAEYTVGEYDIQILSATQSDGLATWLVENGYKLPRGAEAVLHSYIRQGTRFFVAKVNLEAQAQTGAAYLRPLQLAFESPRFMLPIRLGMLNANGKQALFVFALTRNGRVETTNYRTVKLPTDVDIPVHVKDDFGAFYRAMFAHQVGVENERAVFLEYAWDMNWCDPCAADPLSTAELRELGVYWLGDEPGRQPASGNLRRPGPARDVFVTRLHLSYDQDHFPDDLQFTTTGDRSNYQSRYVLRHVFDGDLKCPAGEQYRAGLPARFEAEATTLANLTGWDINSVRRDMNAAGQQFEPPPSDPWWRTLWPADDSR